MLVKISWKFFKSTFVLKILKCLINHGCILKSLITSIVACNTCIWGEKKSANLTYFVSFVSLPGLRISWLCCFLVKLVRFSFLGFFFFGGEEKEGG